jgi:hypothetical protein
MPGVVGVEGSVSDDAFRALFDLGEHSDLAPVQVHDLFETIFDSDVVTPPPVPARGEIGLPGGGAGGGGPNIPQGGSEDAPAGPAKPAPSSQAPAAPEQQAESDRGGEWLAAALGAAGLLAVQPSHRVRFSAALRRAARFAQKTSDLLRR